MSKKVSKYYKKTKSPVKIVNILEKAKEKINFSGFNRFLKIAGQFIFVAFLILGALESFSAFEAHVINVTARICSFVETRTIGFWKTHPDVYALLLPQYLGCYPEDGCYPDDEWINGVPVVDDIFKKANADVMADMLRAQLLAMKFNVAYFPGTGNFEYDGTTISEIIDRGDAMLKLDLTPETDELREALEEIKDLLQYLNNEHQLTHCLDPTGTFSFFGADENMIAQLISSAFSYEIIVEIEPLSECAPEEAQICDTGLFGICSAGIQICDSEGSWSECVENNYPVNEICDDGLDNDCNTLIDCDDGACVDEVACQSAFVPESELTSDPFCGDGSLDEGEECDDGNTEDGDSCSAVCVIEPEPECALEETQACNTDNLGVCAAGTQSCDEQGFWSECVQDTASIAEICDNQLDDDCNGLVDCEDSSCVEDTACQPEPYCGDGNLDEVEECDDGNNEDGDGCSAVCVVELPEPLLE